jgi:hypothetical protein
LTLEVPQSLALADGTTATVRAVAARVVDGRLDQIVYTVERERGVARSRDKQRARAGDEWSLSFAREEQRCRPRKNDLSRGSTIQADPRRSARNRTAPARHDMPPIARERPSRA